MTLKEANDFLCTDYNSWFAVSTHKYLSEDFIRKNSVNVFWPAISLYQHLSEDFIREHRDYVQWFNISCYQRLSEDFIRENRDWVDWYNISARQRLSEDFIRENKDRVDWLWISSRQHLSEDFIRENKDRVYWHEISKYQHLSETFIMEFENYVDWFNIYQYQHLSKEFITERTGNNDPFAVTESWHYKDTSFKKQAVIDTGLYECHDDYFIAYKGIRSDRYSKFNFQYKYEKGGIYESWCDSSPDENSFGLSVWDKKRAKKYCDELVVKVKVRYEDVGRVVHNGGKVRCFRIEILD